MIFVSARHAVERFLNAQRAEAHPIMDTVALIKELAASQFGGSPDAIDVDAPVNQLGIDSLGFLEFLFELEDKLGFPIPQDAVANVKTLRELASVIDGLGAPRPDTSTPSAA
jgi:acyl carrier protein